MRTAPVQIPSFVEITHQTWLDGGGYYARHRETGEEIGRVTYLSNESRTLITTLFVAEPYRRHRIALAMLQQLHADHPHDRFTGGWRNDLAQGLYQYVAATEPDFATDVIDTTQDGQPKDKTSGH